jgi:hypothetical protein
MFWAKNRRNRQNDYSPDKDPVSFKREYNADDIEKIKESAIDKFMVKSKKDIELMCPDCGSTFFLLLKDILNNANL